MKLMIKDDDMPQIGKAKNQTIKKDVCNGAMSLAKGVLTLTEIILVELTEQLEDQAFFYHNHWAGRSQSVRADRYDSERSVERSKIRARKQAIRRLKHAKYIKERREGERVILELTDKGKVRGMEAALKSTRRISDHRLCLVSFDFPEAARSARNHFRLFLKKAGLNFVQGSVWSSSRDVSNQLKALVRILKIERWVKVYVVSE
jgi:hypothetical protein